MVLGRVKFVNPDNLQIDKNYFCKKIKTINVKAFDLMLMATFSLFMIIEKSLTNWMQFSYQSLY